MVGVHILHLKSGLHYSTEDNQDQALFLYKYRAFHVLKHIEQGVDLFKCVVEMGRDTYYVAAGGDVYFARG